MVRLILSRVLLDPIGGEVLALVDVLGVLVAGLVVHEVPGLLDSGVGLLAVLGERVLGLCLLYTSPSPRDRS